MATSSSESRSYSLHGRNLKLTTRQEAQPYVDELEQVQDLEEIHLGGNTLGIEACQAFGEILSKKKTLKVADFADIFTGRLISEIPTALRALCDSLVSHEHLEEIDLSDNAFGGRSSEPMVNLLSNNHAISIVKLNNNGLGPQGGTIVADALFDAAEKVKAKGGRSNLRTLVCSRNRLEDGSSKAWARAFAAHGTLQEVRMFQNGIRMDGIERIVRDGLAHCPDLREVNFNDNTALLKGGKALADLLPSWPKLRILHLGDCLVRSKGAALVFEALAKGKNTDLEELHLAYNEVDRAGLDKLGALLEEDRLPAIKLIDINGNFADEEDECVERIKAALAKTGKEDALGDLDEMEPDGEEEEEEEEDETEEEEDEQEAPEVDHKMEDVAAAAVAVPAATAAVVGAAAAGAVSESGLEDKLANLSVVGGSNSGAKGENAEEGANKEGDKQSGTSTTREEDKQMAEDAADVAESAQEVPEEKQGAEVAADVAESAQEVPEEKQGADVAAEVAESAQEVPEEKQGAEVAADVAESAQEVPEEKEGAEVAAPVSQSAQEVPEEKEITDKNEASESAPQESAVAAGAAVAGALGVGALAATTASSAPASREEATEAALPTSSSITKDAPESQPAKEEEKEEAAAIAPVATAVPVEAALVADTPAAIESTTTTAASTEAKDKQIDSLADQLQEASLSAPEKQQVDAESPAPAASSASTAASAPTSAAATAAAAATTTTPAAASHGRRGTSRATQGSVDLSGELYGQDGGRSAVAEASSTNGQPEAGSSAKEPEEEQVQETPKKKRGFRAAMGAVRELLRG
ncbi:RNI-like protein [Acaromyces ingoldii]|uniref:RNI-like protein n=1 Tax=Acaromyces ingoldii TaxID=215250 RepID=A0A316YR49_9BASI|nr:RNI-like protein [Acaromyces ingoldii]PWN91769.1 RNI-like protein [Acaromyces ingoldii]